MFARLYGLSMRALIRNRGALALVLLLPAVYAGLFGAASRFTETPVALGVVVKTPTAESDRVAQALISSEDLKVSRIDDDSRIREEFAQKRLDAVLVIPDLRTEGRLTMIFDERSAERLVQTRARLESFVQRYNLTLAGGSERVTMTVAGLRAVPRPAFEYLLPSIIMFSVILTSLSVGVTRTVRDRERGVHKRLMVTPLSPRTYLLTDAANRATVAIVQTAIVLVVGVAAFGAQATPALVWLFPITLAGALVFVFLGFVVAVTIDNAEAAAGLTQVGGLILIFLSGGLPRNFFPPPLVEAFAYLPLRPMVEAMRGVVIDQTGPLPAAPRDTAILAAWLLVAVVLGLTTFRFKEPSRRT